MNRKRLIDLRKRGVSLSLCLFLFGVLLTSSPLFADDPFGTATTPHDFCEQIQATKDSIHSTPKLRLIWDLLRVKFAPGSIVRPVYNTVPTAPAQQLSLPGGGVPEGKNLIFSLEPFEELKGGPMADEAKRRYADLKAQLSLMEGQFSTFVRARSTDECVALIKTSGFDFDRLAKISTQMDELEWVGQVKDGYAANRIVLNKLRHLRLPWEYHQASDLMSVFNALRSTDVRNVIIIAHSLSDGNLVDSSFNEYPNRLFSSDISPTLESVSVYSCHGDKVLARYGIDKALGSFPTYHKQRWVFTARGIKLLGQSDVVPMEGLDNFVHQVDRWVSSSPRGVGPAAPPTAPYCTIELSGLQVAQGGYAFLLNGDFVGAVDAAANSSSASLPLRSLASSVGDFRLSFPCALEKAKNVLIMRNSAGVGASVVTAPEQIRGTLVRDGQSTVLPEGTIYRHADGSYQSSKWVF